MPDCDPWPSTRLPAHFADLMDLSAVAIANWHALLPDQLRVAIPNDATADWDEMSQWLAADLKINASALGDVLQRHAGTVAGFGTARRVRTLAWIATQMGGSTTGMAGLLAQERLDALRTVLQNDVEVLAGAASRRHSVRDTFGDLVRTKIAR